MTLKNSERISIGPIITTILVLVIIIISVIFAAVSQANGNVQKGTEEHAIEDMLDNSFDYTGSIWFAMQNGITDLDRILTSEIYTYKIAFITDAEGNIIAKSNLAKYTITENNVFDHFSGGEYIGSHSESEVRMLLKQKETVIYTVMMQQKEYLVSHALGDGELRFFYMLHQGDVERIYSESEKYLKTVRWLGVAYITATIGLGILMVSYITSIVKSSNLKLRLSSATVRSAKEQVRTYQNITQVLSQSYEKIYYVNLSDDRYRVFKSKVYENETPMQYEGEDFWQYIRENIVDRTAEEDKERVSNFFDKHTIPEIIRNVGSQSVRFRMTADGADTYYSVRAYRTESDGEQYMIFGLRNVDAVVMHDMQQLAEKDAALQRLEIYRRALQDNMLAYLEIDLTVGTIIDGPYSIDENREMKAVNLKTLHSPVRFEELSGIWCRQFRISEEDQNGYLNNNSCIRLLEEFGNGHSIVEMNYASKWFDGSVKDIRQNYYMTKREEDGTVVALCVLYDMTEKITRDREIRDLTEELNQSRIRISTGQMQPHFLYNVLGSIREIILEDPQYASDLLCDFTTHLRACIKSLSNDSLIPFSREVENIKAYVNIERMRFGNRMQVEFDIQCSDFSVVPLSIQPLVENAIRHGLYPKKDGMGIVRISTFNRNGFNVIVVKDNGVGFDYEKVIEEIRDGKRDSTGLLNLMLRLGKIINAKVYFDSKIGAGTTVTVLIPEKKEGAET